MEISVGIPDVGNDGSDNEAYIMIYIKSDVKVKTVILYYDLTTLFAELGGYTGMFLGVSFVDLIILCNSAFFKFVTMKITQK